MSVIFDTFDILEVPAFQIIASNHAIQPFDSMLTVGYCVSPDYFVTEEESRILGVRMLDIFKNVVL